MRYQIAVLGYVIDENSRILLLKRNKKPNFGLWSPVGGRIELHNGESPYEAMVRELREETGLNAIVTDIHLRGIITEEAYEGEYNWLLFLFVINKYSGKVMTECDEGELKFFTEEEIKKLPKPDTDKKVLWPKIFESKTGFFSIKIRSVQPYVDDYKIEEEY